MHTSLDGAATPARPASSPTAAEAAGWCTEVASEALDEHGRALDSLIGFAFDILCVQHLDLRVVEAGARRAAEQE